MMHYKIELIQEAIVGNLIKVAEAYEDPDLLIILMEENDLYGNDCFYYINKFDLSIILNTRIFDEYMTKRWNGRVNVNGSILDFSVPY
jgi:hypothetical protein